LGMAKLTSDVPLLDTPTPAVHVAKPRKRRIQRVATNEAAEALGTIEPGIELFALTNGQFSLVDILQHVLNATGPATLDVATWTASDGDLKRAHAFLLDQRVTRFRLLVDPSFKSRKPEFCAELERTFGSEAIRTTPMHGKFALVRNDAWNIAIRTSMNLNTNRRIESVEISDDAALAAFMGEWVDEVFERSPVGNFASQSRALNAVPEGASRLAF
jgi:hypothetical protein